jgi:hypothetical protein
MSHAQSMSPLSGFDGRAPRFQELSLLATRRRPWGGYRSLFFHVPNTVGCWHFSKADTRFLRILLGDSQAVRRSFRSRVVASENSSGKSIDGQNSPLGFWPSSVRVRVSGYGLTEARHDPGAQDSERAALGSVHAYSIT